MGLLGMSLLSFVFLFSAHASAGVERVQFKNADHVLTFEVLSDQLLHFDYANSAKAAKLQQALPTTSLISQNSFSGPTVFQASVTGFETSAAKIILEPKTLCFSVFDKAQNQTLTYACPTSSAAGNAISLEVFKMQNVYGLGEQFQTPGVINGDWSGKIRKPGGKFGNSMVAFAGGNTGNAQFPVLYAVGPNSLNYALFLDTVYPYQWDFTKTPWQITQTQTGSDPSFRGYFILGENLPRLRSTYMDLVGHPLVPPKKAFGMWISEFGYRNWKEIEEKITSLRAAHFPVDGFVLDLYWFGQYLPNNPQSTMGKLEWDTQNFPDPANRISRFQKDDGVGLMTIEEPYVSSGLANYTSMATRGYFVNKDLTSHEPTIYDTWWGKGAGIDFTNPAASAAWHNEHRKKQLTDLGVTFHWTDLGEPEAYQDYNTYQNPLGIGQTEADAHNLYSFYWSKGIADGYSSNNESLRHFTLSRSGTSGIQRFGTAMWSGDIGPNMKSLSGHLNAQMHMSLSGMDYFGADVGGFMRAGAEGDPGQVYTRWFANASLFDVPLRPHTDNGSKTHPTAPDRIGDTKSNLANLRQRYELTPYYYSLAYRAYQYGEAVVPPLVYYFQNDQNIRQIADEKMVGPSLLAATTADLNQTSRAVYLPAGDWVDYHTLSWIHSKGQNFTNVSLYQNGRLQLPLYAKAGAILPKLKVDDFTMNVLGKRTDGSVTTDLNVQIFASLTPTEFHLIEDDGVSESYRTGAFADTLITQSMNASAATVTIAGSRGVYANAPSSRKNTVDLVLDHRNIAGVTLNGQALTAFLDRASFDKAVSGVFVDPLGVAHAKTDVLSTSGNKTFVFFLAR